MSKEDWPKMKAPDNQFLRDLYWTDMYLDAVFDANPDVKRPEGSRRAWGVVACIVARGMAPTLYEWALTAGIDIEDGPDPTRDDSQLPSGTMIDGEPAASTNGLRSEDAESVKEYLNRDNRHGNPVSSR